MTVRNCRSFFSMILVLVFNTRTASDEDQGARASCPAAKSQAAPPDERSQWSSASQTCEGGQDSPEAGPLQPTRRAHLPAGRERSNNVLHFKVWYESIQCECTEQGLTFET